MARIHVGKGPFGLRITPDSIRSCFAFLGRAVALVTRGLPSAELGPRPLKDALHLPSGRAAIRRRP